MAADNFNDIALSINDQIATVTLSRPPVNALSKAMVGELATVAALLSRNDDIHVVVIRSDQKHFCAGADLKERARIPENEIATVVGNLRATFQAIATLPQPVIASVNGSALGGGAELALACDFRFMAPDTRFGMAEVSLGVIPGAGGTVRLPRLVGPSVAKDLIFSARIIDGATCQRLGLADRMVPTAQLDESVRGYAEQLVMQAPLALRAAKQAINGGMDLAITDALQIEGEAYGTVIKTEDRIEGLEAYLSKRPPIWRGR